MTKLKAYYYSQEKPTKESQKVSDSKVFVKIGLAISDMLAKESESVKQAALTFNPDEFTCPCPSPG
ncbi:MAG: hypothetical protein U9N62_08255 [Thermotogota bacterium]|nr:hypothetical protein [Thermotogota bacterium]